MNLREFSSGYYSLDMQVQSYGAGPVIDKDLHDYIKRTVYAQTNVPITMKLSLDNGEYFNVRAENGVPPSVLALPKPWIKNFDVLEDGTATKIFVLKPGYSYLVHQRNIISQKFDKTLEEFINE